MIRIMVGDNTRAIQPQAMNSPQLTKVPGLGLSFISEMLTDFFIFNDRLSGLSRLTPLYLTWYAPITTRWQHIRVESRTDVFILLHDEWKNNITDEILSSRPYPSVP